LVRPAVPSSNFPESGHAARATATSSETAKMFVASRQQKGWAARNPAARGAMRFSNSVYCPNLRSNPAAQEPERPRRSWNGFWFRHGRSRNQGLSKVAPWERSSEARSRHQHRRAQSPGPNNHPAVSRFRLGLRIRLSCSVFQPCAVSDTLSRSPTRLRHRRHTCGADSWRVELAPIEHAPLPKRSGGNEFQ
jgi:hypothetical protein